MLNRTTTAGARSVKDVGDGADRAVGAEVGDPPAAAAGDPEDQEAEFVVSARYAGEDGERPWPWPQPGPGRGGVLEQVGGEVLLGDRDLAGLPSFPEPVQVELIDSLRSQPRAAPGSLPTKLRDRFAPLG